MALTEVWWRGVSGEWTRTTASEADKEFKYNKKVDLVHMCAKSTSNRKATFVGEVSSE